MPNKTYEFKIVATTLLLLSLMFSGCDSDPEVTRLINDLRDDDAEERYDAVKELENVGKRATPAVEALAKCLVDEDEKVRYRAAKTLAKLGLAAKNVSRQLGEALADEDSQVKYYAAKALDEIADHEPTKVKVSLPSLVQALDDPDPKTRRYVLKTLAKLGADAHNALEQIEPLLEDADSDVRKVAESTIRRIKKKYSELPQG